MSGALEISNLNKNFGGVRAIGDFNLTLDKGRIYGLIGPNGAGKTTIFNTITGIYKPDTGSIMFNGKELVGKKPFQIAQLGIGRTFQNIRLFSNLSAMQNVMIASNLDAKYNIPQSFLRLKSYRDTEKKIQEKAMGLLDFVGLKDMSDAKANSLPYGHQRRLEIARAMALNPTLLLLDEPAAGMNADESRELGNFIREIRSHFDLTILMIEHHMDVVADLCDHVTVLNFGKTIADGTIAEVKNDQAVVEAYLGGDDDSDGESE